MKILHINQSDKSGGAAIAGYRLHQGLLAQGIDSRLLVGIRKTKEPQVGMIPRKLSVEGKIANLTRPLGLNYLQYLGTFEIPKHEFYKNADILNFHNLHSGTFNYLAIPSLTEKKPAVLTLHDMWGFTGHCSYSYDCDRWKIGCGKCPYPNTYPQIQRDNTRLEWKLKNWAYSRANLTIITLSHWLTEQVKQSMLARFSIHHIPNGIDTEIYQPLDPEQCKAILRIPKEKKILMFGAASLKDPRKGTDLVVEALLQLPESLKKETILLTIGHGGEEIATSVGMEIMDLGYLDNDRLKSIAFSVADLFIFPSRADNLPLVLQESMACGTPMVSFKVGGIPDLVRPDVTGYLAQPDDAKDFTRGIIQLLEDENLRQSMSSNCRAIALEEYSLEQQAKRYIELYHQVL
ncbi:MAG: glycosyltransferase [Hydrococcus sp. CRU_1_1]|nr:glycosyltransferase [Hydrococcus sp. CRU_1_1]